MCGFFSHPLPARSLPTAFRPPAPFGESTITDDLLSRLPDVTLLVPVKDAFIQAYSEKSGKELYYKTDHHWTSYGAYTAYQAWAASMGLLPYRPEDFEVQTVDTDFSELSTPGLTWPPRRTPLSFISQRMRRNMRSFTTAAQSRPTAFTPRKP